MKNLALLLALSAFTIALGCSGPGAGKDRRDAAMKVPGPATQSAPSESNAPRQLSAQANGGSNLPASMPYSQPNAAAVSQNLNAAPFLTTAGAPMNAPSPALPLGLTSRAEGTMNGPRDRPAAGIGRGMTGVEPARPAGKKPSSK